MCVIIYIYTYWYKNWWKTNCFLWVIPTLRHYSDIVSTYHLEVIIFWHSVWHSFWHMLIGILSRIFSGIHSDICSDILILFWRSFCHSFWHAVWDMFWYSICQTFWPFYTILIDIFWHSVWHSLRHVFWPRYAQLLRIGFGSRRAPLHPELAKWLATNETHSHDELQKEHTRRKGKEIGVEGREGGRRRRSRRRSGRRRQEGGVAPFWKSRDPRGILGPTGQPQAL